MLRQVDRHAERVVHEPARGGDPYRKSSSRLVDLGEVPLSNCDVTSGGSGFDPDERDGLILVRATSSDVEAGIEQVSLGELSVRAAAPATIAFPWTGAVVTAEDCASRLLFERHRFRLDTNSLDRRGTRTHAAPSPFETRCRSRLAATCRRRHDPDRGQHCRTLYVFQLDRQSSRLGVVHQAFGGGFPAGTRR